jgi:YidC/Oxa1 family membrane protein insertase
MQQKRLILALVISSAILFAWTYFYPVQPPKTAQPNANASASPTATPLTQTSTPSSQPVPTAAASAQTMAQRRSLTIRTPLYKAKFDSQGAEPVSWVITKNKNSGRPINSVAGSKKNPLPLELVSQDGLKRLPRQVPLQLITGDGALDNILAASSYRLEGIEQSSGDVDLELKDGEKKQITFVLEGGVDGLTVRKSFLFDAENYQTDVSVVLKRGEQTVPDVRLTVGPSIGDQGISHYTFYSVAPEGVAYINDKVERHPAAGINENKHSPDRLSIAGPLDWAGVGDTYFAMVAVPDKQTHGVEYRTTAYEREVNGKKEKRHLITGFVPIYADGTRAIIYTGPKDHYLLTEANASLAQSVQRPRPIDLDGLIDYGFAGWLSRPIAVQLLKAITYLYRLTGSYGTAIILFTILVYSLFFPLKWRSSKAMKKAQKLAPQMKELQEKIKGMKQNDPRLKDLQKEQLQLMKEGNPLGGCLPLLIQMPFLFALYRAITISLDFRQATFLWLPDLSSGDPYHILEFLMAGTMIILQLITPAPSADPVQRKMMAIGMPLVMLYVLWGAPSGLLLYWLVGNIVGFTQQFLINKWTNVDGDTPPSGKSGTGVKKTATPAVSRA